MIRLHKEAPGKRFEAVSEQAICRYMKVITLEKLRDSLRDRKHVVTVEPEIATGARSAIEGWSRSREWRRTVIAIFLGVPFAWLVGQTS